MFRHSFSMPKPTKNTSLARKSKPTYSLSHGRVRHPFTSIIGKSEHKKTHAHTHTLIETLSHLLCVWFWMDFPRFQSFIVTKRIGSPRRSAGEQTPPAPPALSKVGNRRKHRQRDQVFDVFSWDASDQFFSKRFATVKGLEPQTTIYKCWFQLDESQFLHRKWLFHQTSIYKWLFGVPGGNNDLHLHTQPWMW